MVAKKAEGKSRTKKAKPTDPAAEKPTEAATVEAAATLPITAADLVIDDEFQALIPRQTPDELKLLKASIAAEGVRDPIVAWGNIPIDGHTRLAICKELGIPLPQVVQVRGITSREEAESWIIRNQLGRRNLSAEQSSYLRGRRYNAEKRQGERKDLTSVQNGQKSTTDERLAGEYRVGPRTIRRDGSFASAIDKLAEIGGVAVRDSVLSGKNQHLTRIVVLKLAARPESEREWVKKQLANPQDNEWEALSEDGQDETTVKAAVEMPRPKATDDSRPGDGGEGPELIPDVLPMVPAEPDILPMLGAESVPCEEAMTARPDVAEATHEGPIDAQPPATREEAPVERSHKKLDALNKGPLGQLVRGIDDVPLDPTGKFHQRATGCLQDLRYTLVAWMKALPESERGNLSA